VGLSKEKKLFAEFLGKSQEFRSREEDQDKNAE
jgi:hypothetical protein